MVVGFNYLQLQLKLLCTIVIVKLKLSQHILSCVVILSQLELLSLYIVPQNTAFIPPILLPPRLVLLRMSQRLLGGLLGLRIVRVNIARGGNEGDAAERRERFLFALGVSAFEFSLEAHGARVLLLVHICEGVLGVSGRESMEWRQIVTLMQVILFEVLLNLLERKGRAVVVQVLLYLSPVAKSP